MSAGWPRYRTLWLLLMLGWTVSAADRALTGPVVTWMIDNKVAFLAGASKPYALHARRRPGAAGPVRRAEPETDLGLGP